MVTQRILAIDDEPDIRKLLQITMQRMNLDCDVVSDLASAREALEKLPIALCLTDMRLPDGDGLSFVDEMQHRWPNIPVVVITAHGTIDTAIQAMKSGAFDFLTKPIDLKSLRSIVQGALHVNSKKNNAHATLIGKSLAIQNLCKVIDKIAFSQAPVYISGESGTGKELVARMIHNLGSRSKQAFVPINCGAIPEELVESELFGHKKGAFTGAVADKIGLFRRADGGTLLLDEIAELPLHTQVKLLRVIQEKTIRPVGSDEEIRVDVRILSATHNDLPKLAKKGSFRQDLLYRINVLELKIPPLRARPEDVPLLVEHILEKYSDKTKSPVISKTALELLQSYSFPGNVRELENILERAVTLNSADTIQPEDIRLLDQSEQDITTSDPENPEELKEPYIDSMLDNIERKKILEALEKTRWNRTAAAKLLGISFRALRYRLEKFKIQ